jgi:hypothetical protein
VTMFTQKKLGALALSCLLLISTPSLGKTYDLTWTGTVNAVEGNAPGTTINIGDAIFGSFIFDDSAVSAPTLLPVGGGVYSIYDAPLSLFKLSIGSYSAVFDHITGGLTYNDNAWGQDFIVFGVDGLPGGPFGSTFNNVQFQARGPSSALDGSGIGNGLPYDRLQPSFFASFSDGETTKRIFGSLSVSSVSAVPEPGTWAMMLVGFAMLGVSMRRRRSVSTAMQVT